MLLVLQMCLAMVLLTSGGRLAGSFLSLVQVDPGFQAEGILTTHLTRPQAVLFARDIDDLRVFAGNFFEHLSTLPGTGHVALADAEPLGEFNMRGPVSRDADTVRAGVEGVTASYFRVMGIPLLQGSFFREALPMGQPELVVNLALAKRLFGSQSAIGQLVHVAPLGGQVGRVVGVVSDTRHDGLGAPVPPALYYSFLEMPSPTIHVFVKTTLKASQVKELIASALDPLDPRQRTAEVRALRDIVSEHSLLPRSLLGVVGSFSIFGMALCAFGMYSLMAYFVAGRKREIRLRVVLGATQADIVKWILLKSAKLSLIGCLLGGSLSYFAQLVLRANLYTIAHDSISSSIVVALLGVVLLGVLALAAYPAAKGAASIDLSPG